MANSTSVVPGVKDTMRRGALFKVNTLPRKSVTRRGNAVGGISPPIPLEAFGDRKHNKHYTPHLSATSRHKSAARAVMNRPCFM
jgi:hypothetical protein